MLIITFIMCVQQLESPFQHLVVAAVLRVWGCFRRQVNKYTHVDLTDLDIFPASSYASFFILLFPNKQNSALYFFDFQVQTWVRLKTYLVLLIQNKQRSALCLLDFQVQVGDVNSVRKNNSILNSKIACHVLSPRSGHLQVSVPLWIRFFKFERRFN